MPRHTALLSALVPCLLLITSCGFWRSEPPTDPYLLLAKHTPEVADRYVGLPYLLGADPDQKKAADCSHLVSAVTRNSLAPGGVHFLPGYLSTPEIEEKSLAIGKESLRPGDLVFFKNKGKPPWENHVGVVTEISGEKICFIHASSSQGVRESDTQSHEWRYYWQSRFHSFRRWKEELFRKNGNQDSLSKDDQKEYSDSQEQGWFNRLTRGFSSP